MKVNFSTLDEAKTWYVNSGYYEWGLDDDEVVEYLFHKSNDDTTDEALIMGYLVTKGEDPEEYFDHKNSVSDQIL